ncbi:MAG: helix-turn-helix domain-containing protein, partial [Thermodesulfobacteriota bacterium]|nr:helix-turn-helix domain-containing protein [Thermodesulfobacteriota bacterium]
RIFPLLFVGSQKARDIRLFSCHPGPLEKAMETLLNYSYPGNVRELENILEHALIISHEDIILTRHLPEYLQKRKGFLVDKETSETSVSEISKDGERKKIVRALQKHDWHREKAARSLGINRTTLWRKMKKFAIVH